MRVSHVGDMIRSDNGSSLAINKKTDPLGFSGPLEDPVLCIWPVFVKGE